MSKSDTLRFQIRTTSNGHQHRHLLIDRFTQSSNLLAGLYESYLSASSFSTATIKKSLSHVAALLTWDAQEKNLATAHLMRGQPLTEPQIRQFKRWLEARAKGNKQSIAATQQQTVNEIIRGAAAFEDWCLRYSLTRHGRHSRLIDVRTVQQEFWKDAQGNVPHQEFAEDFNDEEILEIEQYLRSLAFDSRWSRTSRSDFRNYVMWRMAIEYGLRIGEMLAFRTIDLPTRSQDYIKVVRIEERDDPPDPRDEYAPRPKTLSRDLGTYFSNSSFPDLFAKYVAEYRWVEVFNAKRGTKRRKSTFAHSYLFISGSGAPLARSTAEYMAGRIAGELGIEFHWHKCRHSFFNRIYAASDLIQNPSDRERARQQMQYWGGWSSPESLQIYTNTARRDAGRRGNPPRK
ncbi:site-specific integrase (plasmid) [Pseudorhodobacter turbinis]|uniref:Site-specific integrase n=1 Tax=Pseudorhodobacter turbinis TaxID=2500533 RepID=A0A4P8EIS5_9RHOB|nr:site-specific integrase [Pseudorhodobacter turbinis]QCO57051.1 site-specific integrase [Pseudorhodobacter turbinis]